MSDTYTILYIIEDNKDVFPVKVSSNEMVGPLKEVIPGAEVPDVGWY
jgi:hypothetical protein